MNKLLWKDSDGLHITPIEECPKQLEVFNGIEWVVGEIIEEPTKEVVLENGRKAYIGLNHVIDSKYLSENTLHFNENVISAIPEFDQNLIYEMGILIGLFALYGEYHTDNDKVIGIVLKMPPEVYNTAKPYLKNYNAVHGSFSNGYLLQYYVDNFFIEFTQRWVHNGIIDVNCIAQNEKFREGIADICGKKITSFSKEFLESVETILMSLGKITMKKVLPYSINGIHKYGLYLIDSTYVKIKSISEDTIPYFTVKDTHYVLNYGLIL
jgi:hypothetical protein